MSKVPLSAPLTIRLPEDILTSIESVAETCDRSRSWVIVRALKMYLTTEGADILAVREARHQIQAGDTHEMDNVLQEIERIARGDAA